MGGVRAVAILVGLAGCGRLGFGQAGVSHDPDGGIVVPPDQIAVTVFAGMPEANAAVLVERAPGDYERFTTDENGTALFHATGATTFHVVWSGQFFFNLMTAVDVDAGSQVVFGNAPHRPGGSLSTSMSITVPAYGGADHYFVTSESCVRRTFSTMTTQSFTFMGDCAGHTAHLYATAMQNNQTIAWLDAGEVMLVDKGTVSATGAWSAAPSFALDVHGLPANASMIAVDLTALDPDRNDFMPLEATVAQQAPASAGSAMWTRAYLPVANAVWLQANDGSQQDYSVLLATPPLAPGANAIDASMMLPFIHGLTVGNGPNASWSVPDAGTADVVELLAGLETPDMGMTFITWNVIGPPTMTAVTFPELPADVLTITPSTAIWDSARVTIVDVGGTDRAGALRVVDGEINSWLYDAQVIPPQGVAVSEVLYP
jgi:hypothetical protein